MSELLRESHKRDIAYKHTLKVDWITEVGTFRRWVLWLRHERLQQKMEQIEDDALQEKRAAIDQVDAEYMRELRECDRQKEEAIEALREADEKLYRVIERQQNKSRQLHSFRAWVVWFRKLRRLGNVHGVVEVRSERKRLATAFVAWGNANVAPVSSRTLNSLPSTC